VSAVAWVVVTVVAAAVAWVVAVAYDALLAVAVPVPVSAASTVAGISIATALALVASRRCWAANSFCTALSSSFLVVSCIQEIHHSSGLFTLMLPRD
jgi:hypothetical protein